MCFNPTKINKHIWHVLKSMCIVAISYAQTRQTRVDNRVHCERTLQINTSPNSTMKTPFLESTLNCGTFNILSYHCCFIWQKLACRVYNSYLRQAIHDIVTSEISIAKMQMAAMFSLDSTVRLMNYPVLLHKCHLQKSMCH